jgi:tetratricopeptide (TPR) repeat protein
VRSEQIARELDNVRAALAWSLARPDEDARYGLRLFGSLWELWYVRYPREGGAIAERALACASAGRQDLLAAQIYNAAARMPNGRTDSAYGITLLERSLALARQSDDRLLQAEVLRHQGEALRSQDLQAAELALAESLRISRELNDARQEGHTTYVLGMIARSRSDLAVAERSFQHSLALFARLGLPTSQIFVLRELAYTAAYRGDTAAADAYLTRALALASHLGPLAHFSPSIEQGGLACIRGDYQRALELLQAGHDQMRYRGDDHLAVLALAWQARCYQECGDLVAAIECCRQAMALAHPWPLGMLSLIAISTAHTAVLRGQYTVAARVLGCVTKEHATANDQTGDWEEPEWNQLYNRAVATCRTALGEATFQAAWDVGQALSLEQTISEGLAIAVTDTALPGDML